MKISEAVIFVLKVADIKTKENLKERGGNQFLYENVYMIAKKKCDEVPTYKASIRRIAQENLEGYKIHKK